MRRQPSHSILEGLLCGALIRHQLSQQRLHPPHVTKQRALRRWLEAALRGQVLQRLRCRRVLGYPDSGSTGMCSSPVTAHRRSHRYVNLPNGEAKSLGRQPRSTSLFRGWRLLPCPLHHSLAPTCPVDTPLSSNQWLLRVTSATALIVRKE